MVVAVTAIEAAAGGADQPRVPQQSQVVGDQVLRLVDPGGQFADPVITLGERGEELPPQRMGGQSEERRWRRDEGPNL